jgi:hypothetical protein
LKSWIHGPESAGSAAQVTVAAAQVKRSQENIRSKRCRAFMPLP